MSFFSKKCRCCDQCAGNKFEIDQIKEKMKAMSDKLDQALANEQTELASVQSIEVKLKAMATEIATLQATAPEDPRLATLLAEQATLQAELDKASTI